MRSRILVLTALVLVLSERLCLQPGQPLAVGAPVPSKTLRPTFTPTAKNRRSNRRRKPPRLLR